MRPSPPRRPGRCWRRYGSRRERIAPDRTALRDAARAARGPRAGPPHGRRRAQPPHRAPPSAGGDAGRGRGRHRAGAFRGRRVMTTTVATLQDTPFTIGGRTFQSRLMVGTGKYPDNETMTQAVAASGAEIVTVAVRRVNLDRSQGDSILHHRDPKRFFLLANTAGCYTAEDAIRYARLAREAGFNEFVKLEVIGDQETLLPDVQGLLEAARVLVKEGFQVLAYSNEDLITALRLEDAGCAAVMPLASPIGSGLGLLNPITVRTIKRRLKVPVVVDAGVGTASDACLTMEQGVDGILMNTALAAARDPVAMGRAMRLAVEAGRTAYLAGRMPRREVAVPSSPLERMLELASADPRLHDVLRLGAYQLRALARVPAYAAVSTSVELARALAGEKAARYVNQALRRLARAGSGERGAAASHPRWLLARWRKHFGAEEAAQLAKWNDTKPLLTLQPAHWPIDQL